ncbi:MAG: phosphatidate cytidylyltransferase [Bacillota bacterium]|nr:phosphatidate cytidylyltransferase [Bacillota bacterium]
MKTRIISGIVGLALLFFVIWLGKIALGIAVFLVALIGIHEFYNCIEKAGHKPVRLIGYISCIPVLLLGLYGSFNSYDRNISPLGTLSYFMLGMFVLEAVLMGLIVFKHHKYNVVDISLSLLGIFYVVFMFSFIILTRNLKNGNYYIWFIFFAWVTDTMAYFTGRAFGKRKLSPEISPKKTVAGSIGGIIGCVAASTIYGIVLNSGNYLNVAIYHFIVIGALVGILSQVGDLAASAIKRYAGVKDYGNLMPGHGGVLDRFDSILFIAPVIYFYISLVIK